MTQRACTPKVLVRNYGTTTQSFNVTYSISPGNYINTHSVNNLTPGQSAQVTFPEYTFTSNGNFSLKAYTSAAGDENSSNDTVISNVLITSAPRNIVLEYCTGTWCSWCPCAREQAMLILNSFPNAVVFAYHGDINSNDPFRIFNGNQVMDMLDFFVYPSGIIDRKYNIDWMSIYLSAETRFYSSPESAVNIAISNKTYNESTRELNVNYNAAALSNLTGQYKVSYIITEDNIIYSQTAGECGGASNYVHHWVVRNMVNGAAGENMNTGGVWNSGQTISKSFSTVLNESWVPVNCKLQILIYKDSVPLNHSEIQQCIKTSVMPAGINNQQIEIPDDLELSQNYPNPFNPKTNIKFAIPKPGYVSLMIYDITGKRVSVCLDGYQKAGYYNVEFDGTELASGIYFYKLSVNNEQYAVKKMVLLK
jgi:hypothetical protein